MAMTNIGGYYVTCDIHGNASYLKQIGQLPSKSTLIINGDMLGSNTVNLMKKIFYKVKRSEIVLQDKAEQELIERCIHSGTYIAKKMSDNPKLEQKIQTEYRASVDALNDFAHRFEIAIYIVTGNNEDTAFDFDITNGIDKEALKPTEERFIKKIQFDKNVKLVDSSAEIQQDNKHLVLLGMQGYGATLTDSNEATIFTHYPQSIDVTKSLLPYFNMTVSDLDKERCDTVKASIENYSSTYFGHFHPDIPVSKSLPKSLKTEYGTWLRPGAILQLE